MSTVLANTITAVGGGGSTVKVNNDATFISEGGAVTDSNLVQGLNKFFSNIDGDATSISTRDSFNQSGITDNGTGDYDFAFTNSMGNDDYCHNTTANSASGHLAMIYSEGQQNTGGCRCYVIEVYTDNTPTDSNVIANTVAGDLA